MRRTFAKELEKIMQEDERVWLLNVDVGFGVLEGIRDRYPSRYINTGIGEQNAVSMATGMALKGKIPFVYSINSFLVFRAFEQIRMLSQMKQHTILVGVGLGEEYTNFGISHYSTGDEQVLSAIPIKILTPKTKEEVSEKIQEAYKGEGPFYLRLSRF